MCVCVCVLVNTTVCIICIQEEEEIRSDIMLQGGSFLCFCIFVIVFDWQDATERNTLA